MIRIFITTYNRLVATKQTIQQRAIFYLIICVWLCACGCVGEYMPIFHVVAALDGRSFEFQSYKVSQTIERVHVLCPLYRHLLFGMATIEEHSINSGATKSF
jgi:hypothetical protein